MEQRYFVSFEGPVPDRTLIRELAAGGAAIGMEPVAAFVDEEPEVTQHHSVVAATSEAEALQVVRRILQGKPYVGFEVRPFPEPESE